MENNDVLTALRIMDERFGHDSLVSIATTNNNIPFVRTVDGYYENGSFYTITYPLSNKMKQIEANPVVAICGEWFTAHGIGENLGWVCNESNKQLASKLRTAFSSWYSNGHVNESDENTIILRIRLTEGTLASDGTWYTIDFKSI